MAKSPPPIPATNAASAEMIIFIWMTERPIVREPVSLQRTAFMARPVVDRRRFTTKIAMTAKIASTK